MDLHLQTLKRTAQADGTAESWARYAAALEKIKVLDEDDGHHALLLNAKQMQTIVDATDMYSRVLCGQLGVVADPFMFREGLWMEGNDPGEARRVLEQDVKRLLFPGAAPNASYSIAGPNTPESAQTSYDVHQVIRHRLAWERTAEAKSKGEDGGFTGVWHYTPMKTGEQPLPRLLTNTPCPCEDSWCPNARKQEIADS